ncbi:family 16 glycosylhydrolase [Catenovulum sp. SX2]|uniref:family 16 glycosylhydrolase n=1 Tax=Catenovulum sp. SX2 TaxID=3398614 RepID=UPI003F84296B
MATQLPNRNKLARLVKYGLAVTSSTLILGCTQDVTTESDFTAPDITEKNSNWQLVWADEFDGTEIDSTKWTHEVNCSGGGNNEQQCYTDDAKNSYVQDGLLYLVAMAEEGLDNEKGYTSARLNTKDKGDWTYGRFEIRAKLPAGQGTFPAGWMLPTDNVYGGWPNSGEIDIFEGVNTKAVKADDSIDSTIHGTIHYARMAAVVDGAHQHDKAVTFGHHHSGTSIDTDANPADEFHTYAIEWEEGEIRWYVDDILYATQRKSEIRYKSDGNPALAHKGWYTEDYDPYGQIKDNYTSAPFDQDFHLLLNNAVGGDWVDGIKDSYKNPHTDEKGVDPSAFAEGNPLIVDYVRVYQCSVSPSTGKGCGTFTPEYFGGDTLVEGMAPTPPKINVDDTPAADLVVFADGENPTWPLWDCCGGTTPMVETDADATYGATAEFAIGATPTVMGFITRNAAAPQPYNASSKSENGTVEFDLKLLSAPNAGVVDWLLKVESDNNSTAATISFADSLEGVTPPVGQWQHYTFTIKQLEDAGLDSSAIDVFMIFPAWGQGEGAVYRVDNFVVGDGAESPELVLFTDGANLEWAPWDCCGGSTPLEVTDDAEHNTAIEFSIGATETVMGFKPATGSGISFNAASIEDTGVVQFDMKVTSAPTDASATWQFKIESNSASEAVQVALTDSVEGAAPVVGQWQTYTFTLSELANLGLDTSAIDVVMVFPDWGKGNGAVYRIDNAKIYNGAGSVPAAGDDTGNDNSGDDTSDDNAAVCAVPICNGTFDSVDHWLNSIFDVNIVTEGANSFYQVDVTAAGNPWDVNISQVMTITPGATYTVSFQAKSDRARTMLVGLGLNHDPWTNITETVSLTTDWQTFTYDIVADGFGDDNSRVLFDMGAEIGVVSIDDVTVVMK